MIIKFFSVCSPYLLKNYLDKQKEHSHKFNSVFKFFKITVKLILGPVVDLGLRRSSIGLGLDVGEFCLGLDLGVIAIMYTNILVCTM